MQSYDGGDDCGDDGDDDDGLIDGAAMTTILN